MARVTGIGGIFFRSSDTKALAEWYETHLGVTELWSQEAGMTVFAPFKQSTEYFPEDKQWMINFRVDDLDAMMDRFSTAAKLDPQHWVLRKNVEAARAWFKQGGAAPGSKVPLALEVRHDFQLLERTAQPTLPGPLPDDYAEWKDTPLKGDDAPRWLRTPEMEGSGKGLKKRLDVLRE